MVRKITLPQLTFRLFRAGTSLCFSNFIKSLVPSGEFLTRCYLTTERPAAQHLRTRNYKTATLALPGLVFKPQKHKGAKHFQRKRYRLVLFVVKKLASAWSE